jgi:hypothetical protein
MEMIRWVAPGHLPRHLKVHSNGSCHTGSSYTPSHEYFFNDMRNQREKASLKGTMRPRFEVKLKVSIAKTQITGVTFKVKLIDI